MSSEGQSAPVGPDGYFDERIAARYDENSARLFEPAAVDPVVDFLVERAKGGPALELGIGTGRIALPLTRRGVRVHGIDVSRAMVDRLLDKSGGERIAYVLARIDHVGAELEQALHRWVELDELTKRSG